MGDWKMGIVRIISALAMGNAFYEFVSEPTKVDAFLTGGKEAWDDVFDWGKDKFLGNARNTTALQTKKSARQIYAEAFMEDE